MSVWDERLLLVVCQMFVDLSEDLLGRLVKHLSNHINSDDIEFLDELERRITQVTDDNRIQLSPCSVHSIQCLKCG